MQVGIVDGDERKVGEVSLLRQIRNEFEQGL